MQIKSLRIKSYRSWRVDETQKCEIASNRLSILKSYWRLREEGCSEEAALEALKTSRASLFRWQRAYREGGVECLSPKSRAPRKKRQAQWSRQLEQQVLHLRQRFPLWGKRTLTTILQREKRLDVSESTVGRILKKLVKLGKVRPVRFYYGRIKDKRTRKFNKHAKRWKKGMKATKPGELVQIDHMTVTAWPAKTIKHFEATCPVTRITVSQCYLNATSKTAARFLAHVKEQLPFKLQSIQVDGGSEFRRDFEEACEAQAIPLFVLPPRSPELNGRVERCNRTLRYEFYQLYDGLCDLTALREALLGYMNIYNTFRPHQALKQATPMAYYQQLVQEAA